MEKRGGGEAPLDNIKRVLALSIHGINQIGRPGTPSCRQKYADVNAAGGDVTWQSLYDLGIYGNGHMMFWEENNQDIAGVLLRWIETHVEQRAVSQKVGGAGGPVARRRFRRRRPLKFAAAGRGETATPTHGRPRRPALIAPSDCNRRVRR